MVAQFAKQCDRPYQKTKRINGIFNKRTASQNEILNEKSFLGKINTLQIEDQPLYRCTTSRSKWLQMLLNMQNACAV